MKFTSSLHQYLYSIINNTSQKNQSGGGLTYTEKEAMSLAQSVVNHVNYLHSNDKKKKQDELNNMKMLYNQLVNKNIKLKQLLGYYKDRLLKIPDAKMLNQYKQIAHKSETSKKRLHDTSFINKFSNIYIKLLYDKSHVTHSYNDQSYGNQSYGNQSYGNQPYGNQSPNTDIDIYQQVDELTRLMTTYNLWDPTNKNNLWKDKYERYFKEIVTEDIINKIGASNINNMFVKSTDIPLCDDFIIFKNRLKTLTKSMVGGFSGELLTLIKNKIDISIKPIKSILRQNKKVISLCLFDVKFKNLDTPYTFDATAQKPPHFYTQVLNNAINTYKKYLPGWIIRLYIDDTIPYLNYETQVSLPPETKQILRRFLNEENMELFHISSEFLKHELNPLKHKQLTPVLFRYLSLFDADIETCFIGDIDNVCTQLLANLLKQFDASDKQFIIFKPLSYYDRPYINNKCIDNFLAGMIGFKKLNGMILNIEVWQVMYNFFNYFYEEYEHGNIITPQQEKTGITNCKIKINMKSGPFYYGFEENGLTTVLYYLISKFNIGVFLVPLYWDLGMTSSEAIVVNITRNIYSCFTKKFLIFVSKLLLLEDISHISTILYIGSIKHAPIFIILHQIFYHMYFNNIDKLTVVGEDINVFKNKKSMQHILSLFPFVNGYTLDFGEVLPDRGNKLDVNSIYGSDISTIMLLIVDLFEKGNYIEVHNKMKDIHHRIKSNILSNNDQHAFGYKKNIENSQESILFDENIPWSIISLINTKNINYNYLDSARLHDNISTADLKYVENNKLKIYRVTYDHIVPLGYYFHITELLNDIFYRDEEYPFDYVLSDSEIVYNCLDDNFKNYLDNSKYVVADKKESQMGHRDYNKNMFVFINPGVQYDYYVASVESFKKLVTRDAQKLYIQSLFYTGDVGKYNYYYLYTYGVKYQKILGRCDILFLIFSTDVSRRYDVILEKTNGDTTITIIHIYTVNKSTGKQFINDDNTENLDDMDFVRGFLRKINKQHINKEINSHLNAQMDIRILNNGGDDIEKYEIYTYKYISQTVDQIFNSFHPLELLSHINITIDNVKKIFNIGNILGKGSTAPVYLLENKNDANEKYAGKVFIHKYYESYKREMSIYENISNRHQNIINMCAHTGITLKINDISIFLHILVMELIDGNIKSIKRNDPIFNAVKLVNSSVNGLRYIHDHNMAHNDITSANIFYKKENNNYIYKIGDFGETCKNNDISYKACKIIGHTNFMPHESIKYPTGENISIRDAQLADIWALGLSLFSVIFSDPYKFVRYLGKEINVGDRPIESYIGLVEYIKTTMATNKNTIPGGDIIEKKIIAMIDIDSAKRKLLVNA